MNLVALAAVVLLFAATQAGGDEHCGQIAGHAGPHHADSESPSLLQVTSNVRVGRIDVQKSTTAASTLVGECRVWQRRLIPIILSGLAVTLILLAAVASYVCRSTKLEVVHMLLCLMIFLFNVIGQVTMVESYMLAVSIGMSTSWSGFSVGVLRVGGLASGIAAWALWRGDSWYGWVRVHLVLAILMLLGGAVLYAVVALVAAGGGQLPGGLANWVLFSRLLQGLPIGALAIFTRGLISIIAPREEQVFRQIRATVAAMFGGGLGPILVSWMSAFDPCQGQPPDYLAGGPAGVMLVFAVFILVVAYFPPIAEEIRLQVLADHGKDAAATGSQENQLFVVAAVVSLGFRFFIFSGLEVGTAWLLEHDYGCSHTAIGLVTGGALCLAMPMGLLQEQARSLSIATLTWALAVVTTLGSMVLLDVWGRLGRGMSLATLVAGDCLLLPCLALGDGIINGFRNKFQGPPNSLFSAINIQLFANVATFVGAILGPWVARWCLELGGRPTYASCQMWVVFAINLVTQAWMLPRMAAKSAASA